MCGLGFCTAALRPTQAAKVASLAAGTEAHVRKSAAGDFCQSNREAFAATALALDVRIAETEGLIQPLLHEIHDRAVDQAEAVRVDEDFHAAVLEHDVIRLDGV